MGSALLARFVYAVHGIQQVADDALSVVGHAPDCPGEPGVGALRVAVGLAAFGGGEFLELDQGEGGQVSVLDEQTRDLNPVSVRDTGRDFVEDLEEVVEDIVAVVGP